MLSDVPGTPAVSERLRPRVLPVNVTAPVALNVALTIRGIISPP